MRARLPFIVAAVFTALALLFACTGKDPDPIPIFPDGGGGGGSSSTSSSSGATSSSSSSSSGGPGTDAGEGGTTSGQVSGTLDPSFGDGGMVFIEALRDGGAFARAVTVTTDAILVATEITNKDDIVFEPEVVKLDFTGKLVTGFGTQGVATTAIQGLQTNVFSIATDTDGRIAVGEIQENMHPAVFNVTAAGGTDDSTYLEVSGAYGRVLTALGGASRYLGGDYEIKDDLRIWKLTSAGAVEKTLSLPVVLPYGVFPAAATRLRRDVQNRMVVAADTHLAEQLHGLVAARFLPNDTRDDTFGNKHPTIGTTTGGVFFYPMTEINNPVTVSIDRHGQGWVLAANFVDTASANILLLKIDQNGTSVDVPFGQSGQVVDLGGQDTANDMITDGASRIYLAGYQQKTNNRDGFIVRRTLDGTPDKGFGDDGLVKLPFTDWQAEAIVLQPDGRLIVVGTSFDATGHPHGFVACIRP